MSFPIAISASFFILFHFTFTLLFILVESLGSGDYRVCDQVVEVQRDEKTLFHHFNFPFNYTDQSDCRIVFDMSHVNTTKLCFTFKKFHVKHSNFCANDYFNIPFTGKFCGDGELDGEKNEFNLFSKTICVDLNSGQKIVTTFLKTNLYSSDFGFYGYAFPYKNELSDDVSSNKEDFVCFNGQLTSKEAVCNGVIDCTDGSDETIFHASCIISNRFVDACSFENGLCGLYVNTAWQRVNKLVEPPYFDHTTLSYDGYFITVSNNNDGVSIPAVLSFPMLTHFTLSLPSSSSSYSSSSSSSSPICLTFWYFANNEIDGLNVFMNSSSPTNQLTSLWTRSGRLAHRWLMAEIDLDSDWLTRNQIRIEARTRSSVEASSISIDDIAILPMQCHSGMDISCTFEAGMCGWKNYYNAQPWLLKKTGMGSYIVMADSSKKPGQKSSMISRSVNGLRSPVMCLSFKLSGLGNGSAALKITVLSGISQIITSSYSKDFSGFQDWKDVQAEIKLSTNDKIVFVLLDAWTYTGYNLAVDNIQLMLTSCDKFKLVIPPSADLTSIFSKNGNNKNNTKNSSNKNDMNNKINDNNRYNNSIFGRSPSGDYSGASSCDQPTKFFCENGLECIDASWHCDNVPQCSDASDEINCPRTGGPLKYPEGSYIQPATIAGLGVACFGVIIIIISTLFFVATRRRFLQSRRDMQNRLVMGHYDGLDGDFPKPPPYAAVVMAPPSYLLDPPPYHQQNHQQHEADDNCLSEINSPPSYNSHVALDNSEQTFI